MVVVAACTLLAPLLPAEAGSRSCNHRVTGTDRSERLSGTARDDLIRARRGNDRVAGLGGDDCIDAGPGSDRVDGGPGDDAIEGRAGNDNLLGRAGDDRLSGGPGGDRLSGGSGRDALDGGSGNDRLTGGAGRDSLSGGPGDDSLAAGTGGGAVAGGSGADGIDLSDARARTVVRGGPGDDVIDAANGVTDRIDCGEDEDFVEADTDDALIGCENPTRRPSGVFVEPAGGNPATAFSVGFTARRRALGKPRQFYSARLSGPAGSECGYAEFDTTGEVESTHRVSIPLSPWSGDQSQGTRATRGAWCEGTYAGTLVYVDLAADCPPEEDPQPCEARPDSIETIGEFSFTVSAQG